MSYSSTRLGWEDWEFWYWGILPIGLCLIATVLVHHFYWKNTQDIAAPIEDVTKGGDVSAKAVDVPEPDTAAKGDEETGAVKAE